jgi:long-chain acyl-CoA synthetase
METQVALKPGRSTLKIPDDAPDYPTIVHALEATAKRVPDRTAMICEDRSLTYRHYHQAISGLAKRLKIMIDKGDRIAIVMTNCLEMPIAILATMAAGGYVAPMNPNYSDRELGPLLKDASPRVILTIPEFYDRARKFADELGVKHVYALGQGQHSIDHWIDEGRGGLPLPLPEPGDKAMMFFTGGTTGMPKGAEHLHSTIAAACRAESSFFEINYDAEISLSVAPMFHIFGHHHCVIYPLYRGATHVLVKQYKRDVVLAELERRKVTLFAGGPSTVYVGLLAAETFRDTDLSHLKVCNSGGAPCSADLLISWERESGCPIFEGIGMSEGAPIANNTMFHERKIMSVGQIPPLTEVDIVDLDTGTNVMPLYERGEIRVKGPQFTKSYRNRPEETASAIRDGWLYTGDIGYFDDDGYLFVVDRKKEMILSGGFNIYPREVDEVLSNHPDTLEVATVAMKDSFRGEIVKACVVLKPGKTLTEEELINYCKANLADYKVPRVVEFYDALPKTGPGKIDKLKLRGLR